MKSLLSLVVFGLASSLYAQMPPPGIPPQGTPYGRSSAAGQTRTATSSAASIPTETVRLLSLTAVERDLALTSDQYSALSQLASTLPAVTTSEDQAFTAVSKVLTPAQTARLEELLIQDLGYGSLALSDVRTKLSLSQDQITAVNSILAGLESAKKAIIQLNSDASSTVRAISKVASSTNLSLESALTADQRTKLQGLAGKALGS